MDTEDRWKGAFGVDSTNYKYSNYLKVRLRSGRWLYLVKSDVSGSNYSMLLEEINFIKLIKLSTTEYLEYLSKVKDIIGFL